MAPIKDLIGRKFNYLTVKSLNRVDKIRGAYWNCDCDCGGSRVCYAHDLVTNRVKSCGCKRGLEFGEASFNALYSQYKRQALKRNLMFDISKEYFRVIISLPCFYCGCLPNQEFKPKKGNKGGYIYNGIDRINSNLGYILNNIVPCCGRCNEGKMDLSLTDFYNWIDMVYFNIHKKEE